MKALNFHPILAVLTCLLTSATWAGAAGSELLYVANNHGGTITVINVGSLQAIGEFSALPDIADRHTWTESKRADDLVATASGGVLYVSRPMTRDIAAFSTKTEELLWRIATLGKPDHFALSPEGRFLYVAIINENIVEIIDTQERSVAGSFPTAPMPHVLRISPDGRRVYVGAIAGNQMTIADAQSFSPLRTIEFSEGVRPFAISSDEKRLYVQLSKLHGLVEVNLDSNRVTKTIHLPNPENIPHQASYPHTAHHGLALTPDGKYLCAVATVEGYAAIHSVPELDLLWSVPVTGEPSWVIPSLDGKYFFVSARRDDSVSIISLEKHSLVKRIPVGKYPQRMWTVRVPSRH